MSPLRTACFALSVWALGCSPSVHDQDIDDLIQLLRDDQECARHEAAQIIMNMDAPPRALVPALIENLNICSGGARIHDFLAAGAQLDSCWSQRARIRDVATDALLTIGPRVAIPPLIVALANPDPQIAGGSALVLGVFGRHAIFAVPALLAAQKRPELQGTATAALKLIGTDVRSRAVPVFTW